MRKIELMYDVAGVYADEAATCKTCCHLVKRQYSRVYYKCECYGLSCSEASDWKVSSRWTGETVFCNPPYGRKIGAWIEKCYKHSLNGGGTAVMLIPSRTDTQWFHDYVYGKAEIRFVKGRLKFGGCQNSAPFPSLVAIYRRV